MPSLDNMMLRQIIMDHYENPRNRELVEDDSYKKVNMDSETCIDNIDIQAKIENGVIEDIRFDGEACAICTSSTSIMTELLIGKTIDEARMSQDSVGGKIECAIIGLKAGLGDPFFDSIESHLSSLLFSIPAVKSVAFGNDKISEMFGSEANDCYYYDKDVIKT
ncbi:MAG: chorismate synthase, partial [Coprobacillus sp.]|nr:chorismate synthase [Coprobacillus sp.]